MGGHPALARFYRERFRSEFRTAFDAWILTDPLRSHDAPKTPFAMPQYRVAEQATSAGLDAQAAAHADDAAAANHRADSYMLGVVLFATALFFAGISTKLRDARQRYVVLGMGYTVFLGALVWLATLPVELTA